MSLFAKVLMGLGKALEEKGKYDLQKERDAMLERRERALIMLRADLEDKQGQRRHEERLTEISATGKENRSTAITQGVIADRKDERASARDLSNSITLKGVDLNNNKALETFRLKTGMAKKQFDEMLERETAAIADHRQIGNIEYTDHGMVIYKKDGTAFTKPGVKPVGTGKAASGDDFAALLGEDGGTAPSGQARTAPTEPVNYGTLYQKATPDTAPGLFQNGRKIPYDQYLKLVQQGK